MIALGFGCIEIEEQHKIRKAILTALLNGKEVDPVLKQWNDKADIYDKLPRGEAPERYTRIWYFKHDKEIHYMHINRNHAFSPDGWAMLKVEESLTDEISTSPAGVSDGPTEQK